MRRLMMLAPVVALAVASANCSEGAFNSPTSPGVDLSSSATEARGGSGGGKKGGGGTTSGGGTIALVMVDDKGGDGGPNIWDTVTFNVSTTATSEPTVTLNCSQNGVVVMGASAGFYDSYPWPAARNMGLWSGVWTSGAANCVAKLHPLGASGTVLASLSFTAGA